MLFNLGQNSLRFQRYPNPFDSIGHRKLLDDFPNRGMKVEVLMGIDVIQGQTCRAKCLELRRDLILQLALHNRTEKHCHSGSRHVGAEVAC